MSETMELAVIGPQNAVEIFTKGGLAAILDGIEAKVRAVHLDASTASGRDEIRSLAYKVARTKTALDAEAKKLTEGWRDATKQVNDERKVAQERLAALSEEVRAPLTAFENKEKVRVSAHEAALAEFPGLLEMLRAHPNMEAALLEDHRRDFSKMHAGRDWEEFRIRAEGAIRQVGEYLDGRIAARRKFDADQAELARLRAAEIERQTRERDERLKTEAAEEARVEAERKAKAEADAEAHRVIEAAKREEARVKAEFRAEHERQQREAEAKRKVEEDARLLAERRVIEQAEAAKKERARLIEFAERARVKADADLKAAQEKAQRDVKAAAEAAVVKERERAERERKAREQRRPIEIIATLKAVCDGYDYNPGDSDLDNEQPISVRMTIGDYRRASRLKNELEGK